MSSEESSQNPPADDNAEKKRSKKELAKIERLRKRQEAAASSAAAALSAVTVEGDDPLAANYGEIPLKDLQSKEISRKKWTEVKNLNHEFKDNAVLIRGHAQAIRAVGKKMAFVVVRERGFTVQCVLTVAKDLVSPQTVKFANSLSRESIVDIEGVVSVPSQPITGATQQVEIQARKIYCVNRAIPTLPINIEDAARSEVEIEKALQAGEQLVRVNQDTRLNNKVLDMRTHAVQATFRIQSQVENLFRSEGFVGIHTPKLIAGPSEGGSAVFRLDYKGTPACLAQSPQLHKQMTTSGDFGRVFMQEESEISMNRKREEKRDISIKRKGEERNMFTKRKEANKGPSSSSDAVAESGEPRIDIRSILKDIEFLGTSHMTWKQKKDLENRKLVSLGGKLPKKQRLPLSVARVAMKNQKEREEKMLQERLILGRFGAFSSSGGAKRMVERRRPDDRVLKATEGNFRNGVLDVKHMLQPSAAPQASHDQGRQAFGKGKKKKGGNKGQGKRKGGGKKRH